MTVKLKLAIQCGGCHGRPHARSPDRRPGARWSGVRVMTGAVNLDRRAAEIAAVRSSSSAPLKAGSSASEKVSTIMCAGDLILRLWRRDGDLTRWAWAKAGVRCTGKGQASRQQLGSDRFMSMSPVSSALPAAKQQIQPAIKAKPPNGVTKPKAGLPVNASRYSEPEKRRCRPGTATAASRARGGGSARARPAPPGPSPGHDTGDSARRFRTRRAHVGGQPRRQAMRGEGAAQHRQRAIDRGDEQPVSHARIIDRATRLCEAGVTWENDYDRICDAPATASGWPLSGLGEGQAGDAGAWLWLQPRPELEIHRLVRRADRSRLSRGGDGLPRPWRKRQAA